MEFGGDYGGKILTGKGWSKINCGSGWPALPSLLFLYWLKFSFYEFYYDCAKLLDSEQPSLHCAPEGFGESPTTKCSPSVRCPS